MLRTRAIVLVVMVALGCAPKEAPAPSRVLALLPSSSAAIQHAFESMAPTLRYDSIQIDHDIVRASVCPAQAPNDQCFAVVLSSPAKPCSGKIQGPFCVELAKAPPPGAAEVIEAALKATPSTAVWSEAGITERPKASWIRDVHAELVEEARQYLTVRSVVFTVLLLLGLVTVSFGRLSLLMEISIAVTIGVLAFFWLAKRNMHPGSSNEVFLYLGDCLFFGQCHTVGPGSSVILNNGAVWEDLLLLIRMCGGSTPAVFNVTVGMMAAGVALIFIFASRFLTPALAVPASTLALGLLSLKPLFEPVLDNSITFLFSASAALCLLVFTLTLDLVPLAIGAALAAHGFHSHVSGVIVLPSLLVLPGLAGKDAPRSLLVSMGSFAVSSCAVSMQAVIGNLDVIHTAGLIKWVVPAVVALTIVPLYLRGWFARLTTVQRGLVALLCLAGPYLVGVLMLILIRHPVLPGYLPPAVTPIAIGLALILGGFWRRAAIRFAVPMLAGMALLLVPVLGAIHAP